MYRYVVFTEDSSGRVELVLCHKKKFTHDEFLEMLSKCYSDMLDEEFKEGQEQGFYWACCAPHHIESGLQRDYLPNAMHDRFGFEKEKEKPIEVQIDVTDRYKHGEDRTYIDNNAHFLSRKCIGRCFRLKHGETYEERETDCPRCNGNKDWY